MKSCLKSEVSRQQKHVAAAPVYLFVYIYKARRDMSRGWRRFLFYISRADDVFCDDWPSLDINRIFKKQMVKKLILHQLACY